MTFPAGCPHTVWLDWWNPLDMSSSVQGQEVTFTRLATPDLASYPVYVRKGAMLPLQSTPDEEDAMFTWFAPDSSEETLNRQASVPQPLTIGPGIIGTASLTSEGVFTGTITAHPSMKSGWKLVGVSRPSSADNICPFEYDDVTATLTVRCEDVTQGVIFTANGVFPKIP